MKNISIFFFLSSIFFLISCNNDDDGNCVGIDCLPEATTTGEGTFGCLVNGEPFVDKSGSFNCFYQFVDGEYYFSISGKDERKIPRIIRLSTNMLEISEGQIYELKEDLPNQAHGAVVFYTEGNANNTNTTDSESNGNFKIELLNFSNNIVSGTFSFRIKDTLTDQIYNITEGRFDSFFTQ